MIRKFFGIAKSATTSPNFYISDMAAAKTAAWWTAEGAREAADIKERERIAYAIRNR